MSDRDIDLGLWFDEMDRLDRIDQEYYREEDNCVSSGYEQANKRINKYQFCFVYSLLLGLFGVDRFARGQVGIGICKFLFNGLTFGLWQLIDFIIAFFKMLENKNSKYFTFSPTGKYL